MKILKAYTFVLSIVLFAPSVFAQGVTSYGTTSFNNCPTLSVTMQRGARDVSYGGQVSELQKFISDYYDIDPKEFVTGFFGRTTQGYVIKFQKERGLPAFGIAGSMTHSAITKICRAAGVTHSSTGTQGSIPYATTTNPTKTPTTPQPISLQDFVTGHNISNADRINLVFVGINFASTSEFRAAATEMLGWDGRPSRGGVAFGPFAIEPLRSNKEKFNVWYDPNIITAGTRDGIVAQTEIKKARIENSGLSYVVPVFLNKLHMSTTTPYPFVTPHSDGYGMTLTDNSFSSLTKNNLHPVAVYVNFEEPLTSPSQLAHELGHGIFGLADEKTDSPYDVAGTAPRLHAPDCVATITDAQTLWGSLVGNTDPFYTEWKQTLHQNGQWDVLFPADTSWWRTLDDGIKVGYYYGQCYGDTNGRAVIRPTDFSIMNTSQIAVFGSVNRRQVETVLGFFSGSSSVPPTVPVPLPTPAPTAKAPTCGLTVKDSQGEGDAGYGLMGVTYAESQNRTIEVYRGSLITILWKSTNADYSIIPEGNKSTTNGTATYTPSVTKAYEWTFYGRGGKSVCRVLIKLRN
ncbi:hypothetical protein EXS57_02205 [Candidatus Kaiserbacteria bacterium]|nr:hypothetical protein [Candidatus Kaiserbacteria bacterium]